MPMYRKSMLVLILLLLAGIGGTLYGLYGQEKMDTLDCAEELPENKAAVSITVYVTGAVNNPGLVTVAENSRLADVVNKAGGLLLTADSEKVNMAQLVKDGQQLKIPEKNADESKDSSRGASKKNNSQQDKNSLVNINTASEKELDSLPGIGPAMAKRIVEYRESNGSFQSVADLKKIKGIGEAKFNKLQDKICI